MDTIGVDKLTDAEDNIQPTKLPDEIGKSHDAQGEVTENCIENLAEDATANETVPVKTKETIEILNVELVAPRRDDQIDASRSKIEVIINDENIAVIEKENMESSGSAVEEIPVETPNKSEIALQDYEMDALNMTDKSNNIDESIPDFLTPMAANSLSLLTQYQSDDDSDSVIEVPITSTQDYRNQVVEIDSNSDSDDSTDSSGVEYLNDLRKTIEKSIEVADENEEDEDDNEENTGKKRHQASSKLRVKGEMLLEDLPPIQELHITVPENECVEFGKIHSIVDQLILVSALPNSILLNLETVIFLEKGQKVLGEVFDVLGQVADPLYCVRFNSNEQIKEKQINIGDVVYVAPKSQYTQYVILSNLMKLKGSDASWENDIEPPPRFIDYSDDEQEQLARRQLRNKERPIDNEDTNKKPRTVDPEDNSAQVNNANTRNRNRYNEQRNSRGGPSGYSTGVGRPRYNGPLQNQQRLPNYHRNSWHSNYYPHSFSPRPSVSYEMRAPLNQAQTSQAYPSHVSLYDVPPVHNMPYRPTQPLQYGPPPMFHQHAHQVMPNAYSIRPPTLQEPPRGSHEYQYSSTAPPPPGSQ